MARKNDKFQKGSGSYTCTSCGKRTRETGKGEGDLGLCAYCYLSAEIDNGMSDGHYTREEYTRHQEDLMNQYNRHSEADIAIWEHGYEPTNSAEQVAEQPKKALTDKDIVKAIWNVFSNVYVGVLTKNDIVNVKITKREAVTLVPTIMEGELTFYEQDGDMYITRPLGDTDA